MPIVDILSIMVVMVAGWFNGFNPAWVIPLMFYPTLRDITPYKGLLARITIRLLVALPFLVHILIWRNIHGR